MISILECSPNPSDATSYYRTRGVLPFLVREHSTELRFSYLQKYLRSTWSDIAAFDVIFIQRPTTQYDYDFILMCRRMNKIIWLDYDDLHTDIPPSNPVYHVNPDGGKWMLKCSEMATFITCSTPAIQEKILGVNKHAYVVKNAHNDYIYSHKQLQKDGLTKRPKVIWRGGVTHEEDIFQYREQIREVVERYPFRMFGGVSHYTKRDLGLQEDEHISGLPLEEYLNYIVQYNPAFMIYPLVDNPFNKAKSNISALEAIYSGAICIVPYGFEEFNGTAILSSNFIEAIEMLSDVDTFKSVRELHVKKMFEDQVLSKTNEKRYKILKHYTDLMI